MMPAHDPVVVALTGELPFMLILATLLAFPVSLVLLGFYRHAVIKAMGASAKRPKAEFDMPTASSGFDLPVPRALELVFLNGVATTTPPASETLYTGMVQRPWRTAAVYTVAGLGYALVMAVVFLLASNEGFLPLRFLFLFTVFAWPVVLTIPMVAATTWRTKLGTLSVYLIFFFALCALAVLLSPTVTMGQLLGFWALTNLPATLMIPFFLNHTVRAVGPLVLTFFLVAITGVLVATTFVGSDTERMRFAVEVGSKIGLGGTGTFVAIQILGFALFSPPGLLVMRWISRQYERKVLSDQSLAVDTLWLFFGVISSLILVFDGPAWILSGIGAFLCYKVVTWIGFSWFCVRTGNPMRPKLLFLRVFALGKRSEQLYDRLATHWRHVGSIQFISGPDLAMTTVQPHHFLDFLVRRVARQFIDGYQALHHRISKMDLEPDHDGRHRINDFFCHDDTWKMVLTQLVDTSEAVLMDIRGFSPHNAGCVYELNQLINIMPLERVVFVIDGTTDAPFLSRTVQNAWNEMKPTSPNRRSATAQMRIFQYTGAGQCGLQPLLRSLCVAANNATSVEQQTTKETLWDI